MKSKTLWILAAVFGFFGVGGAYTTLREAREGTWPGVGLFVVLAVFCAWKAWKKSEKKTKKPSLKAQAPAQRETEAVKPEAQEPAKEKSEAPKQEVPAPVVKKSDATKPETSTVRPEIARVTITPKKYKYTTIYKGKVVGVSFGGRQKVLARLDENGNPDFSLEESEYKGAPSIKVMASTGYKLDDTPKQIGFIPADKVEQVLPYVGAANVIGTIYGGPEYEGQEDAHNYGCEIEVYLAEEIQDKEE